MKIRTRLRWAGPIVAVAVLATASLAGAATTVVPSPNPGTTNSINALVALSPTEVWGIGQSGARSYSGCRERTLTSRFDGTAFVEVPATDSPICATVNGAAGSSTADIWAVGSVNTSRDVHLRHWDGTGWTTVTGATLPSPPTGHRLRTTQLNAVASLAKADVWTVGQASFPDASINGVVEHFNGSTWSYVPVSTPVGTVLSGVAGRSANDVWAVGSGGAVGTAALATVALHWTGASFTRVATPNTNRLNYLRAVSAVSANDVWAVGDSIKDPSDGVSVSKTLIEHWNGTAWSVIPSPNVGTRNNSLLAVAGRSATDVWAVGSSEVVIDGIPVVHTLALHWNGTKWAVVATPNVGTSDNWLSSVVTPAGSTAVFAAGRSPSGTLVERLG